MMLDVARLVMRNPPASGVVCIGFLVGLLNHICRGGESKKTGAIRLQFSRNSYKASYKDFLPAALAFAQRALAAAEILALAAALIPPFFLGVGLAFGFAAGFVALTLAQRSLAAALILAFAAALMVNFLAGLVVAGTSSATGPVLALAAFILAQRSF
jgi:hypothetical protein